jgi:hypothetical protein
MPRTAAEETVRVWLKQDIAEFAGESEAPPEAVYKARSLDGIWATAPYLHNGSVPNLYELLLPENARTATFHVGSREFDPVNVGLETGPTDGSTELNTALPGNRNTGHTYGSDLTEEERRQLLEYLKTL